MFREKALMVKNIGKNGSYFTLPGGAVEVGETLAEAAIREVKEETGLDIEVEAVFSISEAFFEGKGHHAMFINFVGKITGGEIHISRPEEIEKITWMELQTVETYLRLPKHLKDLLQRKVTVPYIFNGTIIQVIKQIF